MTNTKAKCIHDCGHTTSVHPLILNPTGTTISIYGNPYNASRTYVTCNRCEKTLRVVDKPFENQERLTNPVCPTSERRSKRLAVIHFLKTPNSKKSGMKKKFAAKSNKAK